MSQSIASNLLIIIMSLAFFNRASVHCGTRAALGFMHHLRYLCLVEAVLLFLVLVLCGDTLGLPFCLCKTVRTVVNSSGLSWAPNLKVVRLQNASIAAIFLDLVTSELSLSVCKSFMVCFILRVMLFDAVTTLGEVAAATTCVKDMI